MGADKPTLDSDKIFFPNLNGIRFIAAFMVLIHHAEMTLDEWHYPSVWTYSILGLIGDLGVRLFFTLSGFLITYLLLSEKAKTGTISIRKFYTRRILRIWPLYYFIVLLGLLVLPHIHALQMPGTENIYKVFWKKLLIFLCILPNVIVIIWSRIPYISQTWSIGVEEQFYLMWPWLVKKMKNPLPLLGVIYIGFTGADIILTAMGYKVRSWLQYISIGPMAIGAIGAVLLFRKNTYFLKVVHSHTTFILAFVGILGLFFSHNKELISKELFSLFFMIIIVYLASAPVTIIKLQYKWLDYLGRISYGIYMYHYIPIGIAIAICRYMGWLDAIPLNLFVNIFGLLGTILIAHLSYKYFESRFLERKKKYEVVKSGDH